MLHSRLLVSACLTAAVSAVSPVAAQQRADSIDLRRIFVAGDSANGKGVVDTLPELIQCPQFDARRIRGDETTFSFERRPVIDPNMGPVTVTIEFVVGTNGRIEPHTARVVRSTEDRLNRSFEYWVIDCRFHPGKIGGHTVRVRMSREWEIRPTP
jgi:hypothetical protein